MANEFDGYGANVDNGLESCTLYTGSSALGRGDLDSGWGAILTIMWAAQV